jgi:hypothetical protein
LKRLFFFEATLAFGRIEAEPSSITVVPVSCGSPLPAELAGLSTSARAVTISINVANIARLFEIRDLLFLVNRNMVFPVLDYSNKLLGVVVKYNTIIE